MANDKQALKIEVWDFSGVEVYPGWMMDYPTAWAFVRTTLPEEHHVKCSWRVTRGGLLCDCDIIVKENERLTQHD